MKPHIIATLRPGVSHREVPPWTEVIGRGAPTSLQRDVDRVLREHRTRVVAATQEFAPAGPEWTHDQRACGLDRVFRLVVDEPAIRVQELSRHLADLPSVRDSRPAGVAMGPLPQVGDREKTRIGTARPGAAAFDAARLDEAHAVSQGHADVLIAVLDTGLWAGHREYRDVTAPGRDFVDVVEGASAFVGDAVDADNDTDDPGVGHGSHVAGILVAAGHRMHIGVAPRCRLLPVRVLGAYRRDGDLIGAGQVDDINQGIAWAAEQGASVINMSLGVRHDKGGLPHEAVVAYARRKGAVVVAASGNDGTDRLYYPGALPGVLAVGATDDAGQVTAFSTWGEQVDLVAPGTDVYSAFLDDGYAYASGTSQATPFVSGAAALMRSVARERGIRLTEGQIVHVLVHTADRVDQRFRHPRAGHGVLNLPDALRLLAHRLDQAGAQRARSERSPRGVAA